MSDKTSIIIKINNKDVKLNVEPRLLLVDLLRNDLELTGTILDVIHHNVVLVWL